MNTNNYDYILDFVIPVGATGPIGPTGPASLTSLISTHYNNATATGTLTILSNAENLILPTNSNFFTIDNNGILLKIDNDNLIMIRLDSENEFSFSRTIVMQCNVSKKITILFQKNNNATASAENVYLLIKKLYF